MRITDLAWLDEFVEKIESKHGVLQWEVDDVFMGKPNIRKMKKGRFRGEDVYRALGWTGAGRYLAVFFIHKRTGSALILSAGDMDRKERKIYAAK
jgi:uncharacterized DUF497 family protein